MKKKTKSKIKVSLELDPNFKAALNAQVRKCSRLAKQLKKERESLRKLIDVPYKVVNRPFSVPLRSGKARTSYVYKLAAVGTADRRASPKF
jgi:hypothetical protein